jgi:hypothetical protein
MEPPRATQLGLINLNNMNTTFKIRDEKYDKEEDVIIDVKTEEVVITSSIIHVGAVKAELENIQMTIAKMKERETELQAILDTNKDIIKGAVKEKEVKKEVTPEPNE